MERLERPYAGRKHPESSAYSKRASRTFRWLSRVIADEQTSETASSMTPNYVIVGGGVIRLHGYMDSEGRQPDATLLQRNACAEGAACSERSTYASLSVRMWMELVSLDHTLIIALPLLGRQLFGPRSGYQVQQHPQSLALH